jgi:type I restriction enzyme M protein
MLDNATKRKIDSARQILVGKVPDPKVQVEQITTALVYKFMDDMDKESIELGGEARFFANGFSQYSWTKLMDNRLSGQERLELYAEAIANMSKNPHIPQLFRDIFKGAFLPFRDPRTLSLFLKEINEFNYDHSENLGNAFEYLLSILGSQGDAGQFRTPRHIIDFIVEVVNPQKNETILDPACGTAGFLISAYKHILKTNSSNFKPEEEKAKDKIVQGETATETIIEEKTHYSGDLLSPDDKTKLTQNIAGYDISPDMVKLALVNLYLHGFSDPKIFEYDTLSSDKRWGETFDVILANPPFMTPKGGIVPHKKFSIQANRAEVLFVDYIAEHLSIKGRAGIIVPEGIIFQSAGAYKNLRKNLIENWGLYAVVSLPSGVFQPYSGVKTSILLMDREFAKRSKEILFLKVENDGFDLGAQRRKIEKNDLPKTLEVLEKFKEKQFFSYGDFKNYKDIAFSVPKNKICENGDYNLTGERYKIDLSESLKANFETIAKSLEPHQKIFKEIAEHHQKQAEQIQKMIQPVFEQFNKQQEFIKEAFENIQAPIQQMQEAFKSLNYPHLLELANKAIEEINTNKWPMVQLGEVCDIYQPKTITSKQIKDVGEYKVFGANGVIGYFDEYNHEDSEVALTCRGATCGTINFTDPKSWITGNAMVLSPKEKNLNKKYLFYLLKNSNLNSAISGAAQPQITRAGISPFQIPLPPLEVQEQIVAEIEQYQKIIDGAKQVVENWKPSFRIDPSWEMVELGEACDVRDGTHDSPKYKVEGIPLITSKNLKNGTIDFENVNYISQEDHNKISKRSGVDDGDVLFAMIGTIGNPIVVRKDREFSIKNVALFKFKGNTKLNNYFLRVLLDSKFAEENLIIKSRGGTQNFVSLTDIRNFKIPLPPIEVQEKIVAEIEAEQKIVNANKELMKKMEKKVEAKISEVWGDEI